MSETTAKDRGTVIDNGFAVVQKWAIRVVVIAAALYILGWFFGRTWMIWFPVAMAVIFATVLAPPTRWMRSKGVPDALAAAVTMLGFLGIVGGLFSVVIPQLVDEAPKIADSAASGLGEVQAWLIDGPLGVEPGQITNMIDAVQDWLQSSALELSGSVLSTLGAATSFVVNFVVIMILTFLFIKDGYRFLPFLERAGGRRVGGHLSEVTKRTWSTLGGFIRTQGLVSFIDAVIIGIGLVVVGVGLAIPLAIITFIGGFIPIIGALVSGALAVLVTLVTNGPKEALIVLAIVIVVQQLEGNVLSPVLQGKSMDLHPAIVLLAVTAGGSLFGITGAFLAVPAAAVTAAILRYLNEFIDVEVGAGAPPEDARGSDPQRQDELEARHDA